MRCAEFCVLAFTQVFLLLQYIHPILQQAPSVLQKPDLNPFELTKLSLPVCMSWLVGFVYVFHDFLNILAELLRFGDREFYKDWWNCRNLGEYWRTWNMPVHNFFGYSRHAINSIIFIISAVAHEYMVSIAIGGISYWILVSFAMQYAYIIWETYFMKVTKLEDSNFGNFMFWINFCILGQPILTVIYYMRFAPV